MAMNENCISSLVYKIFDLTNKRVSLGDSYYFGISFDICMDDTFQFFNIQVTEKKWYLPCS